jgi:anhydro-N-acetylmuramic acid kinase
VVRTDFSFRAGEHSERESINQKIRCHHSPLTAQRANHEEKLVAMTPRWLIGLSSGSTADGVDAALLQGQGVGLELRLQLVHFLHQPYAADLRDLIRHMGATAGGTVKQAGLVHRLLGETFAQAARQVADQASFPLHKIQCVGCPGHTVYHDTDGRYPCTLGLGMPAVIAERTGLTTVSDFRARDLAAGGQGLPLTALVDSLLFQEAREDRAIINLGGMSSVVFLPAGAAPRPLVGFQAGPCNVLLDGLMYRLTRGKETFDAWGKHAVQGRCLEPLLERWLAHPALQRKPPKSVPRHEFGEEFISQALNLAVANQWSLHDLLCTATHLVARCVTRAVERFLPVRPQRALLSGGGVRNGLLWQLLEQQLPGVQLNTIEKFGFPTRARKAVGFGGLAALLLDGVPASLTSVTGAAGARLLGSLSPGSSTNWARCLSWMAHHTAALAAA